MDDIAVEIYRQIVEVSHDGILLAVSTGKIAYVNPRVEEIFGYVRGELIGKSVETLIPEAVRAEHVAMREGYAQYPTPRMMGQGRRLQGVTKRGDLIDVEIGLSALVRNEVLYLLAVIRDVHGRGIGEGVAH